MSGIPEATPIILTEAERAELEGLARSTKTEYRLRQRARIVLLAADGMASRAIGRTVRCTTGTASKWRVRYAEKRLAGLDETGDRGAEPKYTAATGKRILALLDQPPPAGYARWSGIIRMDRDGKNREVYAWGIRNSVGMDFNPKDKTLWFTDNQVDGMGDDQPPGELNRAVKAGQNFGFPYYGGGHVRTEEYKNETPPPDVVFPQVEMAAHAAD